jgi:broad specificity phosphatase PhoE
MAKKARKKYKELDFDPYDEFDESFDEELDVKELSREIQSGEWDDYYEETEERFSARRKIERRNDMKKLYSQLDEWEQFGDRVDW